MTIELSRAVELASTQKLGVLVTLKRDGRPQLSNITYAIGPDGLVWISVTEDRAKTANARRDPRVSLYVGRSDGWAYLVLEGTAELGHVAVEPDDAAVADLIEQYRLIQGEHPDWDDFRRSMIADRRLVLRLRPERAYGMWADA